jgi:aminopeptidase N
MLCVILEESVVGHTINFFDSFLYEMSVKKTVLTSLFIIFSPLIFAQTIIKRTQIRKETIPINTIPEYKWWNLLHYTIDITPDYNTKFIIGTNSIEFSALQRGKVMQIELKEPMVITNIIWRNSSIAFKKENNVYIITFPQNVTKGKTETITVSFSGHPQVAFKPPFDNGWIWATDKKGRPWMSIACEGSGASIWLPCKQVLYDEPDRGTVISITVPDTLTAIANGRLQQKKDNHNGTSTYTWKVINPINDYSIVPYIGKYVTWHESFAGIKGQLDCDYWVLDYSVDKAQKHLMQADTMLRCFEYWMGAYPFYEDGYKLIEAPMPGMEHQSAIAYGNSFENGYSGKNLSGTVWGLKWDFILVHESGHEWFGNSVTASDNGETWIHEGFTKYLESLYTEYVFGKEAAAEYTFGNWKRIKNDDAIIGSNTSDRYYKGSAMLHMIRQIIGDSAFKGWFRELNLVFYHHTVNTGQILSQLNNYTKVDFTKIFEQYLHTTQVPILEYYFQDSFLNYRWSGCVEGFAMPLKVSLEHNKYNLIYPTTNWQKLVVNDTNKVLLIDRNFYVGNKTGNH